MKNNLESALLDFRKGVPVIVLDNERENEADVIVAAQNATPSIINFMIKHCGGLICVPMLGKRLDELHLPPMTKINQELHHCKFTVSVDLKHGTTTGISAFDRAKTIKALIDEKTRPSDFAKPGHIFPLRASEGGVSKRAGHTEAAIQMCKLTGMYPAAVICEVIGKDGHMAKLPELKQMARKFRLKIISVKEIAKFSV